MAKPTNEKETKTKEKKTDKSAEAAAPKKTFNFLEYFKSPDFLVLIIFIVMMLIGGFVVYIK